MSQVNPHVVPFVRDRVVRRVPGLRGTISRVEYYLNLDIQQRCQTLAKLRLVPKMFGQDVRGVFLQRYVGTVTITPKLSVWDNFKVIQHPDEVHSLLAPPRHAPFGRSPHSRRVAQNDMRRYIDEGERFVWPHMDVIQHLVRLPACMHACCVSRIGATHCRADAVLLGGHFV